MRALSLLLLVGVIACKPAEEEPDPEPDPGPTEEEGCTSRPMLEVTGGAADLQAPGCAGITLERFTVHGEGEARLELFSDGVQLVPRIVAVTELRLEALQIEGSWWAAGEAEPVSWLQGFQGRSEAGAAEVLPAPLDGAGLPLLAPESFAGGPDPDGISWWVGRVGRADGASVLAGALGAERGVWRVAFGPEALQIVWGGIGDPLDLEAGAGLFLDPIWLDLGEDPVEMAARYAQAAMTQAQAEPPSAPRGLTAVVEGGEDLASLQEILDELGELELRPEAVVLGPGWAPWEGQWTAHPGLQSTAAVAEAISDAGWVPGIWMAPLLVSPDAPLYTVREDWWVLDEGGQPLLVDGLAILDVTQPAAESWLARQIRYRVEEGYEVLWLDELYVGALPGARSTPIGGIEAYVKALEVMREAAGEATLVVAAAPGLPSLGRVDGWQIGPFAEEDHLPTWGGALAASAPYTGRWWWNQSAPIRSTPETSAARVLSALSGGPTWIEVDALWEAALPPEVLALGGQPVWPVELLWVRPGEVPPRWTFADGTWGLLNLGSAPLEVEGPGGEELLTGATSAAGPRILAPDQGELWR